MDLLRRISEFLAAPTFDGLVSLALLMTLCLLSINVWMGRRQLLEGQGTIKSLVVAAMLMTGIQMMPLLIGLTAMLVKGSDSQRDDFLLFILLTQIITTVSTIPFIRPTFRLIGTKQALPEYVDLGFRARVQRMSELLNIKPPVVRLLNSPGGAMQVQAFAGGLPAPSLVVSDGVFHRLSEKEADAILGHELGHIASGSLWWYPTAIAMAWASAVLHSFFFEFWTSCLWGMAMQVGLIRIVSRHFEFVSDRHAAQLAGTQTTINALDKIHMTSAVDAKGWWSLLAFATATHPSPEERLQALHDSAPEEQRSQPTWSTQLARQRKWGSLVALFVWCSVLLGSLFLPANFLGHLLRFWSFLFLVFLPSLFLKNAVRKDVQQETQRRQYQPKSKTKSIAIIATVFTIVMLSFYFIDAGVPENSDALGEMLWIVIGIPFSVLALLLAWAIWKRINSPDTKIRLAIYEKRWQDAVDLGQEHRPSILKNAQLWNDLNLALWMTGDQMEAINAMQDLRKTHLQFKHPWLIQALMHLERENPQAALALLDDVREDLRGDISVHGIAARCYRQLGELENMSAEVQAIAEVSDDLAGVPAFKCAMSIDQGDLEAAQQYWEAANRLAPGDAYITILLAELNCKLGNQSGAQAALHKAKALIDATPFAFLGTEYRITEILLSKMQPVGVDLSEAQQDSSQLDSSDESTGIQ